MKVVISDFPNVLGRNLEYEKEILLRELPGADIVVHPYSNVDEFLQVMQDADGLLTAFIKLDKEVLDKCPRLKAVSINATGYNFVDLEQTARRDIAVCAIGEYCTKEVAEHTIGLMLALDRSFKDYWHTVDDQKCWKYYTAPKPMGLYGRTLGIFGLGKIGQAVALRAKGLEMNVLAADDRISPQTAAQYGAVLVTPEKLLECSDVISNHMNQTSKNEAYFHYGIFAIMKRHPIFINVSRGGAVVEDDLCRALDEGLVRAAGLDVLEEEKPDLSACKLLGRKNVIVTPHAAFYSERSLQALQRLSCENLCYCLSGRRDLAFRIVNGVK